MKRGLARAGDHDGTGYERNEHGGRNPPGTRGMRAPPTYEIRIADQLDEATLMSFAGLDVTVRAGVTVITGQFDQAALHGMLEMIRSLGLDLEEVRRVPDSDLGRRSR